MHWSLQCSQFKCRSNIYHIYNVCAGYFTVWYYSDDNFDTKKSISWLSQFFYENQLAKERRCFHGSFLSIHCQIGNHPTVNKRLYLSSRIRSKFENIWNDYLICKNFFKKLITKAKQILHVFTILYVIKKVRSVLVVPF